jgi:hypothetical protein
MRPRLTIADPVRSDKLWREFQIDKNSAFQLWQSGQCSGQLWRNMLVLSRRDVERLAKERSPQ